MIICLAVNCNLDFILKMVAMLVFRQMVCSSDVDALQIAEVTEAAVV